MEQKKQLAINEEWFTHLIEDCQAIITEAVYKSRQELIEGYWQLGERIVEEENLVKFAKGNQGFLQGLAGNVGVSERALYYAIQFYKSYPNLYQFLGTVEEGKNISWNKIITKYLPTVIKEKKPKVLNCPHCGKDIYENI